MKKFSSFVFIVFQMTFCSETPPSYEVATRGELPPSYYDQDYITFRNKRRTVIQRSSRPLISAEYNDKKEPACMYHSSEKDFTHARHRKFDKKATAHAKQHDSNFYMVAFRNGMFAHDYLWEDSPFAPRFFTPHLASTYVTALNVNGDIGKFLIGTDSGVIQFYDAVHNKPRESLLLHTKTITALDYSQKHRFSISSSLDKTTVLCDDRQSRGITRIITQTPVTACTFDQVGTHFAIGYQNGETRIYDIRNTQRKLSGLDSYYKAIGTITCLAFHKAHPFLIIGSRDRFARLYNMNDKYHCQLLCHENGPITSVSCDNRYLRPSMLIGSLNFIRNESEVSKLDLSEFT